LILSASTSLSAGLAAQRIADISQPAGFSIRLHPDFPQYVGDIISLDVISTDPELFDQEIQEVRAQISGAREQELDAVKFNRDERNQELRATFQWAWDTHDYPPGSYQVTFTTSPRAVTWTEVLVLLDSQDQPAAERNARWVTVETDCCEISYISGTAAERDLEQLQDMAEEETARVSEQLGAQFKDPAKITFLPRVLGHGGFAGDQIYVSYLDRNYAGSTTRQVLHHELVHLLDGQLGGELRPIFLLEGLAVYLSGGHFKPEPLIPRARALLDLGEYIPFQDLANDFYDSQHEAGYLEAASLIEYMVERWSWDEFHAFYRDIHPVSSGGDRHAVDIALQKHFHLSFEELEDDFIAHLEDLPALPEMRQDVRETVDFYNSVREYQKELDPSAYFRKVWLPSGDEMRKRGIVADYLRHPDRPENRILETLLAAGDQYLRAGQYERVERLLEQVQHGIQVHQELKQYAWLFQPHINPVLNGIEALDN